MKKKATNATKARHVKSRWKPVKGTRWQILRNVLAAFAGMGLLVTFTNGPAAAASSSNSITAAKKFVAAHTPAPKKIFLTQPLPQRPPKGVTVDYVSDESPSSEAFATQFKIIAKYLGWNIKILVAGQDPTSQASAMSLAVENHPDAVLNAGFPASTFPKQLAELRAEHVPFITTGTTDCEFTCNYAKTGVMIDIAAPPDYIQRGQWLGKWVAANSNGKANSVAWDLSTYTNLVDVTRAYNKELKQICPKCVVTTQDVVASSIGTTLPSQIVSYLEAHPQVNYMLMSYGELDTGLQAALNSAGLSKRVKIADQTGEQANLQDVKYGESEKVIVGEPDPLLAWEMIDAVARVVEKSTIKQSWYVYLPRNYITRANVGDPQQDYYAVPGYQQQFLKLWKVKS